MNTDSKRVVLGSENPVKLAAVKRAFSSMFPESQFTFESVDVASGVSDQPKTNDETYSGALNRAIRLKSHCPDAEFWVGIEGGIESERFGMASFAWVVILNKTITGKGKTALFYLPPPVVQLINSGLELGEADDRVFGTVQSKRSTGAVGLLTDNVIDRESYYFQAAVLALIPFKNPSLY